MNAGRDQARYVEYLHGQVRELFADYGRIDVMWFGPTGRGEFDERALARLAGIGEWMRRHGRAIYDCTQAPPEFLTPQDCRLTYSPDTQRLYVHLLAWPYKHLHLDGAFAERVAYAQLLNDASEIKLGLDEWHAAQSRKTRNVASLTLNLPVQRPNVTVPVIELFLRP